MNEINEDAELEEGRREAALELAIRAGAGQSYNGDGNCVIDSDLLIEAAKKFETYLKGAETQ